MTEAMFTLVAADPVDTPPERVYLDYYQLSEAPFAITPDPEFLFSSSCHQQVLDKISYAIDGRMGFILLTGEVGTGKTTLCRKLLDQLRLKAETVYVINPSVSGQELLASILEDLGEAPPLHATKKALIDQLNQRLLTHHPKRPFVVIIDDAQTMKPETLEDLRLLSNLETDKHKLIQVVLSGQPELLDMLANSQLRQLKQRIAIHCRLQPLSAQETVAYISRRLFVAGNQGQVRFSRSAMRLIHKTSGGIPRLINKTCDFALTAGYVRDAQAIEPSHVKRALAELDDLDFHSAGRGGQRLRYLFTAAIGLVLIAAVLFIPRPGTAPTIASMPPGPDDIDQRVVSMPTAETLDSGTTRPASSPAVLRTPTKAAAATTSGGEAAGRVVDEVNNTAAGPGDDRQQPDLPSPAPYCLQLASFRTAETAKRSAAHYRKKGIAAHWQMVANGTWYRIVTGKFTNQTQAARYKTDHGLKEALVIRAPLTVKVLPNQAGLSDAHIRKFLLTIGYDSLMETGLSDDNEIYTGLFSSMRDATITAQRISQSGQLLARVVSR